MGSCQGFSGMQVSVQIDKLTQETQKKTATQRQVALIQAYIRGSLVRKRVFALVKNEKLKLQQNNLTEDIVYCDQIPQTITERSTVTQQIEDQIPQSPLMKSKLINGWQNGNITGLGKLITPDGYQNKQSQLLFGRNGINYFKIKWDNGFLNGQGVYCHPNGSSYKGEWRQSQLNGFGIYYNSITHSVYEGNWQNNQQHGIGTEIYGDKSKYCGTFKNCIKNGRGEFYFTDGSYYIGEFQDDKFHGKGKFVWEQQTKTYNGEWENGKKNGTGILELTGKYIYNGHYKDGKKSGLGKLSYVDGRSYIGEWFEGHQHGNGTFQSADGKTYNGNWKFGVFQSL